MQLYLVRHGIAIDGDEGLPDDFRWLSDKGRRRFQKTAQSFGRLGHKLDLILTSPLVRAVQTAEILAGTTRHREVAVLEQLDPKFDVESLRAAVETRAGDAKSVALVGHEPQLSSFLSALCGVSQADIDFKKGAIVRIDAAALGDPDAVVVRWWLKPKSGAQVKGVPLQKRPDDGEGEPEPPSRERKRRAKKAKKREAAADAETNSTPAAASMDEATSGESRGVLP